jgi:uroporphyrinogen-III synthase
MTRRDAVLVTRPLGEADPLVAALRAHGRAVVAIPTVVAVPEPAGGALDTALATSDGWDWIVVTSAEGARALAAAWGRAQPTATTPGPRIAAVGPATASALSDAGFHVDLVAEQSEGVGLARALASTEDLHHQRILLPRADLAGRDLPDALRASGAQVREVIAYRSVVGPEVSAVPLSAALRTGKLAAAVVASPSAARGLLALAESSDLADVALDLPIVSIGPTTTAACADLGFRTVHQADRPTLDALVAAVEHVLTDRQPVAAGSPT